MSWRQLIGIGKEMRDVDRQERARPIIECPNDGSLLDKHPRTGELNCPMGDYRVSGGTTKGQS